MISDMKLIYPQVQVYVFFVIMHKAYGKPKNYSNETTRNVIF